MISFFPSSTYTVACSRCPQKIEEGSPCFSTKDSGKWVSWHPEHATDGEKDNLFYRRFYGIKETPRVKSEQEKAIDELAKGFKNILEPEEEDQKPYMETEEEKNFFPEYKGSIKDQRAPGPDIERAEKIAATMNVVGKAAVSTDPLERIEQKLNALLRHCGVVSL
jgi:hypothetical protein